MTDVSLTPPPITATLLVSCRDRTGIVAALSDFVFKHNGNILDADQHAEFETDMFFMRLRWELGGFSLDRKQVLAQSSLADAAHLRVDVDIYQRRSLDLEFQPCR